MPTSAAMELKVLISILQSGTGLNTLLQQTNQLGAALTKLQKQAGGATPSPPKLPPPEKEHLDHLKNLDAAANKLIGTLKFLAGGFLALQSVRFIKDLADTAARAQVLATVLHVVGLNAGYSRDKLDEADRKIQALGITAMASRQSLTQFLQAELDLADAPLLARAAQDAAVILGTDSSTAFERLVTAVQTSNTLMLRHMGIIVSADTAYQKYATSIGKSVTQLTAAQRAQAFLNATLEQAKKIQGSYTAAMGDVGKQLTSLDRLTTDLKTSLGNNLLPAYLAIVQELTLFLQQLKLTADGIYGQGEGARALGQTVQTLARAFFTAVKFLIEYRDVIIPIILLWASLSKVLIPVINLFFKLKDAMAGIGGSILVRIIAGIGLLASGLILLGGAIITAQLYFPRFNAAIGGIIGVVLTAAKAFALLAYVIAGGLVAALETLYNRIAHPFDPASWINPWKEWAKGVKGQIDDIRWYWDNAKASFEFAAKGDQGGKTPQETQQERLEATIREEAELMVDLLDKQREFNSLKEKGTKEAIKAASADISEIGGKIRELDAKRQALNDVRGVGQGERDLQAERLQTAMAEVRERKDRERLEKVREKSKFRYVDQGEVSKQFDEQMSQFVELLDAFNRGGDKAKVTAAELGRNFVEATGVAKTRGDLEGVNKALKDLAESPQFKKLAPSDQTALLSRARAAAETARLSVRNETLRETGDIAKLREQYFRQDEKRRADHLQTTLDLIKSANELEEQVDQQSYSRRGMDLDQYFDRRRARLDAEQTAEMEQAKNRVATLERELAKNIPRTAEDVDALMTKLAEARADVAVLARRQEVARTGEDIKREDTRIEKNAKAKQTLLDIAAVYGEEVDALAAVNAKYDEQETHLNTIIQREANLAERRREVFETEMKYLERRVQIDLMEQKALQENLELYQAGLDITRQRVTNAQTLGQISEVEAMRQRNNLTRLQQAHDEALRASKQLELQRERNALLEQEAAIRKNMPKDATDEATQLRIRQETEARRKTIQGLTTDIANLNVAIEDSAVKIESYSRKIHDSFVNSFADALTQTIMHVRNAGEIWKAMANQITAEIIGIFTKAFSQKLFAKLSFGFLDKLLGLGGGPAPSFVGDVTAGAAHAAEGGLIRGPGTGTSDSVPILASTGEHIMPAAKTARYLPLLEGIRLGTIVPAYALGGAVTLQSIALPSIIPRRYASGGVVVSDGGAGAVQTGATGTGNMVVTMHPDTLNMTMREWLEHEVVRQYGRR
jgi:hypothetical protein